MYNNPFKNKAKFQQQSYNQSSQFSYNRSPMMDYDQSKHVVDSQTGVRQNPNNSVLH